MTHKNITKDNLLLSINLEVKEAFKDWEPKDFSEMVKLEEKREKKEWMRAYRRFNLDTSELFKEKEEN